ncbi:transposase family protein [Streptomyces sp. NBC_00154]|uniref:transposase family protein n=1 Tax=Streptomyces sp. NBC_00154 TaxID=2975670 RepID=UPI00225770E9|nr:transposase family protein [Streptomyces sp. NBC_00154]MCX5318176.1 transposase family protein [Streptomyces sp. NBC_00154]
MNLGQAHAAMSHYGSCGLPWEHFGELGTELGPQLGGAMRVLTPPAVPRRRAGGAPKYELVFTDRLLVALVHLRTGLTREALGVTHRVGSSMIGRATGEIRLPLAERGVAVPQQPGLRLRTLADVFAYAEAENVTLRINGAEVQARWPKAGRPGRAAFVSGKRKQNTIKTTISDGQGRTLWCGAVRPGRMHDQTARRTEGIAEQFRLHPRLKAEADEGYRGLADEVTWLLNWSAERDLVTGRGARRAPAAPHRGKRRSPDPRRRRPATSPARSRSLAGSLPDAHQGPARSAAGERWSAQGVSMDLRTDGKATPGGGRVDRQPQFGGSRTCMGSDLRMP